MINYTIYALRNTINKKVYIGQTVQTLRARFNDKYKGCKHINNAIKCYGAENFYYEIIAICSNKQMADYLEDLYIEEYNARNKEVGYNIRHGGSHGKLAEETKIKMSIAATGENNHFYGKNHSEETIQKISKTLTGKKLSLKTIEKLSGENNHNSKISWSEINLIRQLYVNGKTINELSGMYNIAKSAISSILHNKSWKDTAYIPKIRKLSEAHINKRTGNKNPAAKLNWENVGEIRRLYIAKELNRTELSNKFNISLAQINRIIKNKAWVDINYNPNIKVMNGDKDNEKK